MSADRMVEHPQLGQGTLLKTYMGGYEWEVEFESGRRFRLPAREFETDETEQPVRPQPRPTVSTRPAILDSEQFRARQTLEALRYGIVPMQDVETLTIGLEAERVSLDRALARARESSGDVQCVIGDYGFGKSHFLELAARRALRENYVVMTASLDLLEAPPNKPYHVYHALVHSTRYPNADIVDTGLGPLLEQASRNPAAVKQMIEQSPIADRCPIALGLGALADANTQAVFDDLVGWLSGSIHPTQTLKPYIKKLPRLYHVGETARLYTYLLTAWAQLASLLGYSGLAVLIDESEHYSLLRAKQRGRADSFFTAMIAAAVGNNSARINIDDLPQHHFRDYPTLFATGAKLYFLFALTESESNLPIDAWLSPRQIVRLDDRYIERDIQKFIRTLMIYHGIAYAYTPDDGAFVPVVSDVPTMLSQTLSQHRINMRELIRISVTIFDLLYLHDELTPGAVISELRQGLYL